MSWSILIGAEELIHGNAQWLLLQDQGLLFDKVRTFYDCWSSSEDSKEESCRDSRGTRDSSDRDGFDDYACTLDGEYGLMSRSFRSFSFSKSMSAEKAMSQCLKAFYLVGNPKDYTLYEMNEKDGSELKLDMNGDFKNQLRFDPKRPTLVFRRECPDDPFISNIKVFSGDLIIDDTEQSIELQLDENTTAQQIVNRAVQTFQKMTTSELDSSNLRLTMVSLNFCVSERILDPNDRPWELLSTLRAESCRALQLTRFCLRLVFDAGSSKNTSSPSSSFPNSTSTTKTSSTSVPLFVGNLKENLSQFMYERLLSHKLGDQLKWESIEVIYYESGCLVLNFSTFELAEEAYDKLRVRLSC
ncbi:unnamed protein product [Rodentolepis nana]|uniref:Ras-associating domain-containing protein n=1 Tax=Rodentolepis nana TaxID=102285 RepID=A0A0R3TXI7_RODNA|nr:unnamed protein product [Rodentolepis nana]